MVHAPFCRWVWAVASICFHYVRILLSDTVLSVHMWRPALKATALFSAALHRATYGLSSLGLSKNLRCERQLLSSQARKLPDRNRPIPPLRAERRQAGGLDRNGVRAVIALSPSGERVGRGGRNRAAPGPSQLRLAGQAGKPAYLSPEGERALRLLPQPVVF